MQIPVNRSKVIAEFESLVRCHFQFLEDEHGFHRNTPRAGDLNEPRDAWVSVRYVGETVAVQIGMSPSGSGIGVVFRNERWLDSIVRFRSSGSGKTLLQRLTSSRRKHWPDGFLAANPDAAVATLADMVKEYAADIIRGDTSAFAAIVAAE